MRRLIELSITRFSIVGVINTIAGLAIIFAVKWIGGLGDVAANAIGYGAGAIISFTLNRQWTFNDDGARWTAFVRFIAVLAAAYGLNLLTVLAALRIGINDYVAQAMGIIPYFAFSYVASRYLVFTSRRRCLR